MTVEVETSRVTYTGDGDTGPFTVPFYFLADEDLVVIKVTIADGTEEVLVLTTDYSVTGEGDEDGGTVTLVSSISSSYKLVIYRDPEIVQETAYPPSDPFPSSSHERAMDRLTMICQRLASLFSRCFRLSDGDVSNITTDVNTTGNAGKYFRVNAGGTAIEFADGDLNTSTFTQSGVGAVERTVTSKLGEVVTSVDFNNTRGTRNIGVGVDVFAANTTGVDNTSLGHSTLKANTTGHSNTAIGCIALEDNTTGTLNVAVGVSALSNNTTGANNVAVGVSALSSNTTADGNVAIGGGALAANTTGVITMLFNPTGAASTGAQGAA